MKNITRGIIIFTILIIIFHQTVRGIVSYFSLTPVVASNREWHVVGDFQNKKEAAELLSRVNARMIEFMRFLKKKYHIDEPDDLITQEGAEHAKIVNAPNDVYNIVDHLLDNYNPDNMRENDPRYSTDTSYTVNKGDAMYICLRRKDDPTKLVDENDLFFVLLHEAGHESNYNDFGHSTRFWQVFKFILHEAQLSGVYTPVDYAKAPINYCGLWVEYNPLFDDSLPNLWVD